MAVLTVDPQPVVVHSVRYESEENQGQYSAQRAFFGSGDESVSDLRVGNTSYPLRRPLHGKYYSACGDPYEFTAEELGACFIGRGDNAADARKNWRDAVHQAFQSLIRKRPFEMDEEDRARWRILQSVIDVPKYRRTTPMTMRQIGRIQRARPTPTRVAWANGAKENVALDQAPGVFASLKPSQWFEAVVKRDSRTGRLREIVHLWPIRTVRLMSPQEQDEFWESLPTAESLPDSNVDWTSR